MTKQINEYALNIHLISFDILPEITKGKDIIINVSTRPDHLKESISVTNGYCEKINHDFKFNIKIPVEKTKRIIKGQTEFILFSFRSKEKFNLKPRIAIARLDLQDFQSISSCSNETKIIDIYKTSEDQKNEYYEDLKNGNTDKYEITENFTLKKVSIGKMKIQLSISSPYYDSEENPQFQILKHKNDIKRKSYKYEKLF